MKLFRVLSSQGLARSNAEAQRLVKSGAVRVGGCSADCDFFHTGNCNCGGWERITDPTQEIAQGLVVKVGTGFWRLVTKMESRGFDQLPGVCWVPAETPIPESTMVLCKQFS